MGRTGLGLILMSLLMAGVVHAADVSLTWTAPTTNADGTLLTDLAGFRVYAGVASQTYDIFTDAGLSTAITLPGFSVGTTYWFTVTAVNLSGLESLPAPEIAYTIPSEAGDSLVLAFNFNEGSGRVAHDQSTYGNHGTISGAVWTSSGKYGNALNFDGRNDLVTVADHPSLDLISGMTLMAWVYPTTASGTRDVLIKEGMGIDSYNLYARNWHGLSEVTIGNVPTAEGPPLPRNTWSHVAAIYDGVTLRLYRNGVQIGSRAVTGVIIPSTAPLRIGGNILWPNESFKGRIDEVRIYRRALAPQEIQHDQSTPIP